MRRALVAALAGASVLLVMGVAAAPGGATPLEPVTVTANAPETVEAGKQFNLEVAVEAEAGALDIAALPLTLGVKLAPECGGSLAGTPGSPVLEKVLPNPQAGAAYSQTVTGTVAAPAVARDVVCAFLQDTQERQFGTDTEAEVNAVPAGALHQCTTAEARRKAARRSLKRLNRRIRRTKRKLHHAHGAHRTALQRKLRKLRAHRRKVRKRERAATRQVTTVCS